MSQRAAANCFLATTAVIVLLLVPACDDDSPTDPGNSATGTVTLDPSPDAVAAPWTLAGPDSYAESGAGDQTLSGLSSGDYSVTWGDVAGMVTPDGETKTLATGATVVFGATYLESGIIVVDSDPDGIAAPWSLTGPDGFTESGNGDRTLTDILPGEYQVTWGDAADHVTPPATIRVIAAGETATFRTRYARLVSLAAGSFTMGSPPAELGRDIDEVAHSVVLTRPFVGFECEVTNQQYAELAQWAHDLGLCHVVNGALRDATDFSSDRFLDLNVATSEISYTAGVFTVDAGKEDHPANHVTWHGAAAFCNWLSQRAGLPRAYDHDTWECNAGDPYGAPGYRLPTEAEWEYACRAGSSTAFANGEITEIGCDDPVLAAIGWHCGVGTDSSQPTGQLLANAWGLLDLHGNVFEWCQDRYGLYAGDATDPIGAATGLNRVMRGGSWNTNARYCRSAARSDFAPFQSAPGIGLRPVRSGER